MSAIGLDVGTSRVKAVRFDDEWRAADVESEPSAVRRLAGGQREQDLLEVWDAAARVVSAVARRSPDPVRLVTVTGQGDGCWLVDAQLQPAGPAMLWNDSRAVEVIEGWRDDGRLTQSFRRNGCQGAPGMAHAQLVWLRAHRPEVLERASTLLSCSSWIYARLTGRLVLEETDAANPFFDARARAYDPELLELFGISDLARLLPDVVAGTDRAASLRPALAAELSLPAGCVITLAPYDVPATAIGTGVVATGQAFAILGTTLCVGLVSDDPRLDRTPTGMTLPGAHPAQWLIAYATMIGTEVLDWAAAVLGLPDANAVTALAATSQRQDLPTVLPYLSPAGERSPFLDTSIRGSISGLDIGHSPADVARAVLDSLSLVVKDCLDAATAPDQPSLEVLALSGGGAASELWCQSISDATGVVVRSPDVPEVGARGAVLCGAVDAGWWPDLDTAVRAAVHSGRAYEPDPDRSKYYEDAYHHFVAARDVALGHSHRG